MRDQTTPPPRPLEGDVTARMQISLFGFMSWALDIQITFLLCDISGENLIHYFELLLMMYVYCNRISFVDIYIYIYIYIYIIEQYKVLVAFIYLIILLIIVLQSCQTINHIHFFT